MMRQMRENTKWIMLVTALAFVALMVFEWGMDASGRTAMGVGQIGSVDGQPVMYQDYLNTLRNLQDQVQNQQEEPLTSLQNTQLEDQAFRETVNQILIQQELERRGISVTAEEIQQAARFSPPPQIRQNQGFQTDGQFDLEKYQNFLASSADNQFLLQLEQYYRNVIPRSKLMRQVTSGIYPSDAKLWRLYREQNEQVRTAFAALNPGERIPDAEVSVSDDEIRDYYRENREEEFSVPARATVKVAALNKAPTPEDTAAALERAREVRREIVEQGADFAEVAQRESGDEGTLQEGGDLGTFARGQMVEPFEEAVFDAAIGQVTEPVKTRFGYHLINVRDRQQDSATVSHILIPIERTGDSELRLLTHADSLEDMAESMTLDEAASNLGVEVSRVEINESFPVASGVGRIQEGADWVFNEASQGDVSPVFENEQAFYALELVNSRPAGYRSLDEVRSTVEQTLRFEKKKEEAMALGRQIAQAAREAGSLAAVASDYELQVDTAGPFTRQQFVSGLGRQNEAVGAAFGLEPGEIGGPVATADDVFVLEQVEHLPADSSAWEAQKQRQRQQFIARAQQERLQEWLAGLRENARIADRRDEVLQAQDEQQQRPMGSPLGF